MNAQVREPVTDNVTQIRRPARFSWRARRPLIAAAVAAVFAVGGGAWILMPPSSEKTDDAYIGADVTTVAPRVRGFVAEVLVRDNQKVRAGQPLVRIDPEEFDARVSSAKAELADAEAGVASAAAGDAGGIVGLLLSLISFVVWLFVPLAYIGGLILGAVKGYQGQAFKFPLIGNMAEKIAGGTN